LDPETIWMLAPPVGKLPSLLQPVTQALSLYSSVALAQCLLFLSQCS